MNSADRPKPPVDFEESPELTDEDFARARRMSHGQLIEAGPYAAARLRELLCELDKARDGARLEKAREHIEAALAELESDPAHAAE